MRTIMAPDVSFVDHPRGRTMHGIDELLGWLQEWVTGMSDARVEEARYLDAGTHSVAQFRGRGINDGELVRRATGRALDLAFCEVLGVEEGRITSGAIYYDAMTMLAQFGVVEALAAA